MLVFAFLTCLIWPKIQLAISSMQTFLASSGGVGVFIYTFLERALIPTGLHHFIYGPFIFGPAVVPNGIEPYWIQHVAGLQTQQSLSKLFSQQEAFALHGNSKVFGAPGLALAIYFCANKENREKMAALLIPATLTSILVGITEPLEFTFLFISPVLFLVHSVLAAALATVLYEVVGVAGNFGAGLLQFITQNWIFTIRNHTATVIFHILVGLIFTGIWFIVFRTLILKFNIMTPGRGQTESKLYSKKDYKDRKSSGQSSSGHAVVKEDLEGAGSKEIEPARRT